MSEQVRTLTTEDWDENVLRAPGTVLVDFWAAWCPPCRALAPTIDALAHEFAGRVTVGKLNVDDHPDVASRYGVMSIPTLLVFQGGRVVEQRVGALPITVLRGMLEAHTPQEAGALR